MDDDAQPEAAPPIPAFALAIIEEGHSPSPTGKRLFADILQSVQANYFAILAGVDSAEFCAFVNSVKLSEQGAIQGVDFKKNVRFLKSAI